MWEHVDTSFNSFDLNFTLNETNTDDDTNNSLFFSDDQINSSKNLSFMSNTQIFSSPQGTQFSINDDPLCFRKETSTQSFLANDEFDLIGHPTKELNRFNDLYMNHNLNYNNNNNNLHNLPLKSTKRGRGRGSRGSYKPRGGTRNRMLNQINQQILPSFNNSASNNIISFNNNLNLNQSGSNYVTSSTISNSHQKVCINPEILRRLGYQQNSVSDYVINPQQQCSNYNYDGNFMWNNALNALNEYKLNDQIFDNSLNDRNQGNFYSLNINYDTLKQNVEETNFFGDFDTKCFLDISGEVHQMINVDNSNLTNCESNFDSFFDNISKDITSTSDLINDQINFETSSLNLDLEKFKTDQPSTENISSSSTM